MRVMAIFALVSILCHQGAWGDDANSYTRVDNRWPNLVIKDGNLFYWDGKSATRLWEEGGQVTYGPRRLPVWDWVSKAVRYLRGSDLPSLDGFERVDQNRWPNLVQKNGRLFYLDRWGTPRLLYTSSWGNITMGDTTSHYQHVQNEVLRYFIALMNENPTAWSVTRQRISETEDGQAIVAQAEIGRAHV